MDVLFAPDASGINAAWLISVFLPASSSGIDGPRIVCAVLALGDRRGPTRWLSAINRRAV